MKTRKEDKKNIVEKKKFTRPVLKIKKVADLKNTEFSIFANFSAYCYYCS